uniref:CHHC U11-48K-type domain-containing protein n=1 Tax=Anopheles funestus TaxID=62324 RepID=A0A182S2M0_ANOFN
MSDEMMICPYDKSHIIVRHRMPYHLVKCKKHHDKAQMMESCPFNAMHVVLKTDMKEHIGKCPDYITDY